MTCTRGGAEFLETLAPKDTVRLVYHGLDLSRFPSPPKRKTANNGASETRSVELITVGRAVAKKGIDTLLTALSRLPDELHWHWTHVGGGPLRDALREQAEQLGISGKSSFLGALPQSQVLELYRKSDLFILPSRIDETGDRDGLPNVIVEAQSQRLAVISTAISGIPELIEDGSNGLLIKPDDVNSLIAAIIELSTNTTRRIKMGIEGEKRVRCRFNHLHTIGELVTLLDGSLEKNR